MARAQRVKSARLSEFVDCGTAAALGPDRGLLDHGWRLTAGLRASRARGQDASGRSGYGLVGPNGAGHFVKMVHNGVEYGMMQAYARLSDPRRSRIQP